jgi:hypothetical protein
MDVAVLVCAPLPGMTASCCVNIIVVLEVLGGGGRKIGRFGSVYFPIGLSEDPVLDTALSKIARAVAPPARSWGCACAPVTLCVHFRMAQSPQSMEYKRMCQARPGVAPDPLLLDALR